MVKENGVIDKDKTQTLKEKVAKALAGIFNLNYETILKRVSRRSSIETIVKKIDKEKADELIGINSKDVFTQVNFFTSKAIFTLGSSCSSGLCGV